MLKKIEYILLITILYISLAACSKSSISDEPLTSPTPSLSKAPTLSEIPIKEEIKHKSEEYEDFYSITKDEDDNYTIKLYDKDKKILDELTMPKEPHVKILENDIVQVIISYGNPFYVTYFYDTNAGLISEIYDTPVHVENRKIILVKNNKLIISDIFDKKLYYKEIKRNFTQTVPPSSAIFSAKFVSANELHIVYYEGEDYTEKTETIDLSE